MSRRLIVSACKLRKQLKENDEPFWCEYCGMPADTVDHFKPVHFTNMASQLTQVEIGKLLYACRECNSIAGAEVFKTLAAKRKHIQTHLRKKYAKYLKMPHWSDDELEEMGSEMRRYILHCQTMKGLVLQRVRWPRQ